MKKIAIVPWGREYLNDEMFSLNSPLNRDNCHMVWIKVREYIQNKDKGIQIHTIDCYDSIKDVDMFLFFCFDEYWYNIIKKNRLSNKAVYFAFEPPVVDFKNSSKWISKFKRFFKYILTWNDDLVDGVRILKFFIPYYYDIRKKNNDDSKKLLVNISGNKMSTSENELYSERLKVITFFDGSDEFELYGTGWDKGKIKSYKGLADSKISVYRKFKYALCLENMKNVKGYITEKILDCFCAGIVPIYWGAENIDNYVSPLSYIHYDTFENLEKLKDCLINLDESQYKQLIEEGQKYLRSEKAKLFMPEKFADTVLWMMEYMPKDDYIPNGNWIMLKIELRLRKIIHASVQHFLKIFHGSLR